MSSACVPAIIGTPNPANLDSGVTYTSALTPQNSKIHQIALDASQQVAISVVVNTKTTQNVNIVLTIYNSNLVIVRQTTLTSQSSNSITDLEEGTYFVCLRVIVGVYNISVTANYTRFVRNVQLEPSISHCVGYGEFNLGTRRLPVACAQPLRYEIIDGELPTGLTLLPSGFISGVLPILDTTDAIKIPSANLFVNEGSEYTPIGHPFKFRVRLSLFNNSSVYVDANFYIAIVNNWSLSEDQYTLGLTPTVISTDVIYKEKETQVLLCCDTSNNLPNYTLTTLDGNKFISDVPVDVMISGDSTGVIANSYVEEDLVECVTLPNVDTDIITYFKLNYTTLVEQGYTSEALDYYIKTLQGEVIVTDGVKMVLIRYKTNNKTYSNEYYSEQQRQLMNYNPVCFSRGGEYGSFSLTTN